MKKLFPVLIFSILLSGCNTPEPKTVSPIQTAPGPLIGVVFETGERAYTSEEYNALSVKGSVLPTNPPESTYYPEPISYPIDSNYTGETLKGITDKASTVATYAIGMRTILNEYVGDNYDADFGYDAATINLYGINKTESEVQSLEKQLSTAAAEMGLPGYPVTVNILPSKTEIQQTESDIIVYLPGGSWDGPSQEPRYHAIPDCRNMDPSKAIEITLSQAKEKGYQPCKNCNPPQ